MRQKAVIVDKEIGLTLSKKTQVPDVNSGSPMPMAPRETSEQMKTEKAPTRERSREEPVPVSKSPSKATGTKVKEASCVQKPSKIEIPAVVAAETPSRNVVGDEKPMTPVTSGIVATPPLMSPHPATPATATSEVSRASAPRPRTLRVSTGATQKIATEPAPPSTTTEHSAPIFPPPVASHAYPKPGVASRRLSISSNAKADSQSQSQSRPSTPAMSERLMSEGVSRPGSPPPSIVGSAPERTRTKNQLKKERREKARTQNISIDSTKESIRTVAAAVATEEVGPIVARQKKQKRSKAQQLDTEDDRANEPARDSEDIFPAGEKDEAEPASSGSSRAVSKPDTPVQQLPPIAQESYTVRQFYADAASIKPEYRDKYNMVRGLLQHRVSEAQAKKVISSMIATGDLTKDHPWLSPANHSFNSTHYKLPTDGRKGQDYLDAHGYVGNHAFGYVYLPAREKRALERGNAVGIANSTNTEGSKDNGGKGKKDHQEDLLKRCLITPTGTVYRHLTAAESDKMLELEERRQFYVEEFGEDVGGMHALAKPLEIDDYINLSGGMEELGRYGERHGVVWVSGADDHESGDQGFDDENEHDGMNEDAGMISDETDDLGIDLDPGSVVPGAWDAGLQAGMPLGAAIDAASQQPPNTLAPMRNQRSTAAQQQSINLRALDLSTLQKMVAQKQKELEAARKEMEKMEKAVGKRNREVGKWREGLLKA
jgi:hypothetical protein